MLNVYFNSKLIGHRKGKLQFSLFESKASKSQDIGYFCNAKNH